MIISKGLHYFFFFFKNTHYFIFSPFFFLTKKKKKPFIVAGRLATYEVGVMQSYKHLGIVQATLEGLICIF
jgi:hypothetical protein